MKYQIEVKSRKRPAWQPLVIVPIEGASRFARFDNKEIAKRCLGACRLAEDMHRQYRTPSTRRTFRLVKTNAAEANPNYTPPDLAMFV